MSLIFCYFNLYSFIDFALSCVQCVLYTRTEQLEVETEANLKVFWDSASLKESFEEFCILFSRQWSIKSHDNRNWLFSIPKTGPKTSFISHEFLFDISFNYPEPHKSTSCQYPISSTPALNPFN